MKKHFTLFTLLLVLCSILTYGQETKSQNNNTGKFQIIKTGSKYSKEIIASALSKANLCGNFFESKSNDIVFDDGAVVRLFSKNQINDANLSNGCFVSDSYKFQKIIWAVHANGNISKGYELGPNKSYK